jgi:hypothetical protein
MTTVASRVKPNWTGNSGIPEPPPEEVVDPVGGMEEIVELMTEEVRKDRVELQLMVGVVTATFKLAGK